MTHNAKRTPSIFCLLLLAFTCSMTQATNTSRDVTGEAYRQATETLLYREVHSYSIINDAIRQQEVIYTQPDGTPWAQKTLTFGQRPTAPSFTLTDSRNQESLQVTVNDKHINIQRSDKGKQYTAEVGIQSPLVVDAGFDPFVRQHWKSLNQGKPETFFFLLPRRERLVELKLISRPCTKYDPDLFLCLSLDINNWFLRMLVDTIELTYQRSDKRLVQYRGVSNLSFPEQDDTPHVDIYYRPQ
ncbi:hypothetical protein [Gilvimarinus agarilyticus]|uniref:hypothetical protein n=1 Tax=Gilvimarinus agarilyticus TaxID=679259 RepID=UPI00059EF25A|nr:hypothetical protein [Gilvimarinus agarilyticus]